MTIRNMPRWLALAFAFLAFPAAAQTQGIYQPAITGSTACAAPGTFASRPAAASCANLTYSATDLGTGVLLVSNGTNWKPATGSAVIAQANPATNLTGTAVETNLASISIPAGLLSANGSLRITAITSNNSTAGLKNLLIRFAAASGATGTSFYNESAASTTGQRGQAEIRNNASVSSQNGGFIGLFGFGSNALSTSTINTAAQSFINLDGLLATTTDNMTLNGYTVEWLEP